MGRRFLLWLAAVLLLAAGIVVAFGGCGGEEERAGAEEEYERVRLVLAINGTDTSIDTMVARRLSSEVAAASDGNVRIEVYPNDQLAGGNTTEAVHMVASGAVDLAAYVSGTMSLLDARLQAATFPWAFSGYAEARRVIDGTGGAYYEKVLAQYGLVYLGSTHNGMRQLTNNRNPVRRIEDMEGMRIRVLGGEGYRLFFEALGAVPTPMSWSELATAIRQGTIDGQENSFSLMQSARLNEIQKYMTVWNCSYENYLFVANRRSFDGLEPKTQALIRVKVREACEWGRDYLEAQEAGVKADFIAKGMEVAELSPEELAPFQERVRPLAAQLKELYGAEACAAFQIP